MIYQPLCSITDIMRKKFLEICLYKETMKELEKKEDRSN